MGQLWQIVEEYRTRMPYAPSNRQMAGRIGMSPTAFGDWKDPQRLPAGHNLLALAELTGVPYVRVLDAALHDTHYLPESEVRSHAGSASTTDAGATPARSDYATAAYQAAGSKGRADRRRQDAEAERPDQDGPDQGV